MTGNELYKTFLQTVDADYTGFVNFTRANRFIQQAFIANQQDIYRGGLGGQNAIDEMSSFISLNNTIPLSAGNTFFHSPIPIAAITLFGNTIAVSTQLPHGLVAGDTFTITGTDGTLTAFLSGTLTVQSASALAFSATLSGTPSGTITPNTGVVTSAKMAADYYHYLWGEATFVNPTKYLCHATNTSPVKLTLNKRTSLRSGDKIRVTGFGAGNANGDFYVKFLNEKLLALYTDKNLTVPLSGSGITGTGSISEVVTSELKDKKYDQKGAILGTPTVLNPYFQIGKLQFHVYPEDKVCETVKIDYVKKLPVTIDTANTTDDLLKYYTDYFLYNIIDRAAVLFSNAMRDGTEVQLITPQIIDNK